MPGLLDSLVGLPQLIGLSELLFVTIGLAVGILIGALPGVGPMLGAFSETEFIEQGHGPASPARAVHAVEERGQLVEGIVPTVEGVAFARTHGEHRASLQNLNFNAHFKHIGRRRHGNICLAGFHQHGTDRF